MRPIIEFCLNNYHHGTEKLKEELEKNMDYDVLEYDCLGHCKECEKKPFALVESQFVSAKSVNELAIMIKSKISELEKSQSSIYDQFL